MQAQREMTDLRNVPSMERSAETTKLITKSANGIQTEILVKEQTLGTVTSFK